MRILLTLLILLIFISCGNDQKVKEDNQATGSLALNNKIDSTDLKRQDWYVKNLIPKHELLISFSYSIPTEEEKTIHLEKFKEIRGYENKISKIEITQFTDSLTVIFYKRNKRACEIKGNISILSDTVKLLFKDICSPFDRGAKRGEFYKFKYVIKSSPEIKNKTFKPEEGSLLNN
jgi:hypothetical protein